jgi:hypothetical protein
MITNYWIEQNDKDVLAQEIEKHIQSKYGVTFDVNKIEIRDISTEIGIYLNKVGKTQYKVFIRITQQNDSIYKLNIEIP